MLIGEVEGVILDPVTGEPIDRRELAEQLLAQRNVQGVSLIGLRSDHGVIQLGRLMRRYPDAVEDFQPPEAAVWRNPLRVTGRIIRHGDFSPFNTTWFDDTVVGLIDWDLAKPGRRIDELAFLAWQLVPLEPEGRCQQYGLDPNIDLRARLKTLCDAYGGDY